MLASRSDISGITLASGDDCEQLSESRYILAKYQLRQKPSRPVQEYVPPIEVEHPTTFEPVGPEALSPHLHGGEFHWNKETTCQLAWCCCVPCLSMNLCWIRCCERIYDAIGKYVTKREESHRMACCTMRCCLI